MNSIYDFEHVPLRTVEDTSLIICDVDNTVCESCTVMDPSVADAIVRSTNESDYTYGFMSGTDNKELMRIVGVPLLARGIKRFILMGNSGSHVMTVTDKEVKEEYQHGLISPEDKSTIIQALKDAIVKFKLPCESDNDDQILDRGTQITLSCIGRTAPKELKDKFDPEAHFRSQIIKYIEPHIPGYTIRSGGTTSIDILVGEFDKGQGLELYFKDLGSDIGPGGTVFYGDSFSPTGNDYPAARIVECIKVGNPHEFRESIEKYFC